jgi:predicted DNA-binding transcriptional regulator AlpA
MTTTHPPAPARQSLPPIPGEHKPPGEGAGTAHARHDTAHLTERLIRLPDCLDLVRIGRTAWLDMVREKQAPQSVKIGRATFWVASEVQGFIADRIRLSRGGVK